MFPPRMANTVEEVVNKGGTLPVSCRTVADTIAGMTEQQALHLHHRLHGVDFGPLADPAVM
jgi:dGTP triphosphohydrolase